MWNINKVLTTILALIIFLTTIVTAITWEDEYARLSVEPAVATIHADGFYYQTAELCSKVGSTQSLSLAFLFDRQLDAARIQAYNNGWNTIHSGIYAIINPYDYGFISTKEHSYRYEDVTFTALECKSFRWRYKTDGSGKWDLAAWIGNLLFPTRTWLLDPYFNNTFYFNNFLSAADIADWETTTNTTITNGKLSLERADTRKYDYIWEYPWTDSSELNQWALTSTPTVNGSHLLFNLDGEGIDREYGVAGNGSTTNITCEISNNVITDKNCDIRFAAATSNYIRIGGDAGRAGEWVDVICNNARTDGVTTINYDEFNTWYFTHSSDGNAWQFYWGNESIIFSCDASGDTTPRFYLRTDSIAGCETDYINCWNGTLADVLPITANASYGEAILENISSYYTYLSANLTMVADSKTQTIELSISNDGGVIWHEVSCVNNSLDWTCDGAVFAGLNSSLKLNLTLSTTDAGITPEVFNISVFLTDVTNPALVDINFSKNIHEGIRENHTLNLTIVADDIIKVNATLTWNNTVYDTITAYNLTNVWHFATNFTIPWEIGETGNYTVDAFWNYTVQQVSVNTSLQESFTQNIGLGTPTFTRCNTTNGNVALNISLYDELNQSRLIGNLETDLTYYLSGRSEVTQSYNIALEDAHNFTFCIYPTQGTFVTDYEFRYSVPNGYQERRNSVDAAEFTNTTTQIKLYLLETAQGIFARFKTIDAFQEVVTGVAVTMNASIDGDVTIEEGITDSSGIVTFFVDIDTDYTFKFVKTGFLVNVFTLRPTSTDIFTVTMASSAAAAPDSISKGILYTFRPSNNTLNNNTEYDFEFDVSSSFWNITYCYLFLTYINDTEITNTNGFGGLGDTCNLSVTYDTGNHTRLVSKAVYEENGTLNVTATRTYNVGYFYKGEYSLQTFIDDISSFAAAGFNDFTRMIIALVIIIALTIGAASLTGLADDNAIIGLFLAVTFFFSYTGWLTVSFPGMPTNTFGVLLSQYFILIILSLAGFGLVMIRRG